jgi:hypothetical protein
MTFEFEKVIFLLVFVLRNGKQKHPDYLVLVGRILTFKIFLVHLCEEKETLCEEKIPLCVGSLCEDPR